MLKYIKISGKGRYDTGCTGSKYSSEAKDQVWYPDSAISDDIKQICLGK